MTATTDAAAEVAAIFEQLDRIEAKAERIAHLLQRLGARSDERRRAGG